MVVRSSEIFFKQEQKNIMKSYRERIPSYPDVGVFRHNKIPLLPVEGLLSLDPIVFFREMQRVTDDWFLVIFWHIFNSNVLFHSSKPFTTKSNREFALLISLPKRIEIALKMIYHLKVYLMERLLTYSGDRSEMLCEARSFYNLKLSRLIQEILGDAGYQADQIKNMNRSFLFYYKCIQNDIKSMIISEFYSLRAAHQLKKTTQFEIHVEHLTFLAGALKDDKSSVFGYNLIHHESPFLIGCFLRIQHFRYRYLNDPKLLQPLYRKYHWDLVYYLLDAMATFDESQSNFAGFKKVLEKYPCLSKVSSIESMLFKEFTNNGSSLDHADLFELTRCLFNKILFLKTNK
jgi:hypothetical protein